MAPEDSEDVPVSEEHDELTPQKRILLARRRSLRAAADAEQRHADVVRPHVGLHPLEEGRSFILDDMSCGTPSGSDVLEAGGGEGLWRSASASPSFHHVKTPHRDVASTDVESQFRDNAKVIARDVARVFAGHDRVDQHRVEMAAVLRSYARHHPDMGYTQGMCFLAAVACASGGRDAAGHRFRDYMSDLGKLWISGFPLLREGMPLLKEHLGRWDLELNFHLWQTLGLNITAILPTAWLSIFGKWLSFEQLLEIVPFLASAGLPGFLTVTVVVLISYRSELLRCKDTEEALLFINTLRQQPAPPNLLFLCNQQLPTLTKQVELPTSP